jgi:hypothetical protein
MQGNGNLLSCRNSNSDVLYDVFCVCIAEKLSYARAEDSGMRICPETKPVETSPVQAHYSGYLCRIIVR